MSLTLRAPVFLGLWQWLEFELTNFRTEYIKLRTLRTPKASGREVKSGGAGGAGVGSGIWQPGKKVMTKEELRKLEAEVLGLDEEGDGYEGEGEAKDGGKADEDVEVEPPWAKDISDDIDKHIKAGRAPPIVIEKTGDLTAQEREMLRSPCVNGRESPERDAEPLAGTGGGKANSMFVRRSAERDKGGTEHSNVFDRLADQGSFTGIHKHVNEEVSQLTRGVLEGTWLFQSR